MLRVYSQPEDHQKVYPLQSSTLTADEHAPNLKIDDGFD